MSRSLLFLLAFTACTDGTDSDKETDTEVDTDVAADTDADVDTDVTSDTDLDPETDIAPPCDPQWIPADLSGAVTVSPADLGGTGASGVVTWNAPSSGTLLLCHDTYRISAIVGAGLDLTISSADADWPATLDGETSPTIRTDGATSLTLTDVLVNGQAPLTVRCMNAEGRCVESGGITVTLTDVVVEAGPITSENESAMLTATDTTFRARAGFASAGVSGEWHTITADGIHMSGYTAGGFSVSSFGPNQTFTDSTFREISGGVGGNAITLQMGAVFSDATVTLTGSTFTENNAGVWNVVYVVVGSHVTVNGGTFIDNTGGMALDTGAGQTTVNDVTVVGQINGGGVLGVPDTWTNIDCDGVWDSCVKVRGLAGANPVASGTIQNSTMINGINYAVQITENTYSATLTQLDFGTGSTANEHGDVAYGGNFYNYDGVVTSLSCTGGTCQ